MTESQCYSPKTLLTWRFVKFTQTHMIEHPFNTDFTIVAGKQPVKDGIDRVAYVCYQGVSLAKFTLAFEPSAEAAAKGKEPFTYKVAEHYNTPIGYIRTYGYMAEFNKQRHEAIGDPATPKNWQPKWSDDMFVKLQCPTCNDEEIVSHFMHAESISGYADFPCPECRPWAAGVKHEQ